MNIIIGRCVVYKGAADDVPLNFAEKNVGSILLNDVVIGTGTNEGMDDGTVDGITDKFSKEAYAPSTLSSSVIPTEPTVG